MIAFVAFALLVQALIVAVLDLSPTGHQTPRRDLEE
jgi:hypothetical protein